MDIKNMFFGIIIVALTLVRTAEASSSQYYTVQISSPKGEKQAHNLVTNLRGLGIDSFEAKVIINGKKHFRVCSGYFESAKAAKVWRTSVLKQTRRKDVFVQKMRGSTLPDKMLGNYE